MRRDPTAVKLTIFGMALLTVCSLGSGEAAAQRREIAITSYQTTPVTELAIYTSLPIYLKYYEAEGLNVTFKGAAGGTDSIQQLISGSAQIDFVGSFALITVRSKGVPIKAFYRSIKGSVCYPAVLADSPITDIRQFKGKVIGVNSLGSGCIPLMKAMMAEMGMNPDKDVNIVVAGVGAQALAAIRTGKVDVLGLWDAAYWEMEALGAYRFRKITTPLLETLSWANTGSALEEFIRANPDVIVGVGRAVAKATLFALTNPEASVRIHWLVYPTTKPTGVDEATALTRQAEVLRRRIESLRIDVRNLKEHATTEPREAEAMYKFLSSSGMLGKPLTSADLYTNEFIGRIFEFDAEGIVRQAKGFKLD